MLGWREMVLGIKDKNGFKLVWEAFGTLKISKMALRRRMAEGMPFVKFGSQLRFFPKAVDEWLIAQN
ncbi:MerR family transcriptional regulator [Pedobacter sandarakinus]|uniref:hypothetical protein n=1 Tax=Pedobacter sandarakinus TaxID=353156 RepID=UPI0022477DD5|nr:hypothetical protein [Pedobacter sandarakinus]MCX2573334.1 hypothetical protein [Pedobacter sandarakinus]